MEEEEEEDVEEDEEEEDNYNDDLDLDLNQDDDEDLFERCSFDHFSYDEGMTQNLKPMLQRRSSEQGAVPRLHRSARRVPRPTTIPSPFNTEVEHSKCVWLNVNSQVFSLSCSQR